ncbi:hypothetical protein NQD34_002915 [Periophthalmus magnuspinnatus]|nr:hypothetical protein NQD34_002915 [Periophthalmus magnuspinnatus]
MLPQAGREFLVRIRFFWRPLFQGRYLLLTNTVSSGGMLGLGDVLQQAWEKHKDPGHQRDWRRTGEDRGQAWEKHKDPGHQRDWRRTESVWCRSQIVDKPRVSLCVAGMGLTEGRSFSDGCNEFREKFWEFYKADWCVWPAAQMINFYFLPPKFRVVYINTVTLGWDTYLSYLKHRDQRRPPELISDAPGDSEPTDLSRKS